MKRCRSVQDQSRAVCEIFTCRYRAPCRAIAMRLLHPTSPYSTSHCIEPPEGGFNTSSTPPSGDTSTLSMSSNPLQGYEYTFYATLPRQ
eukprot:3378576-Ditylum_brightwellii.AAC.1